MGRRHLLILGFMLSTLSIAPGTRGQGPEPRPSSDPSPAAALDASARPSEDLPAPPDSGGTESDQKPPRTRKLGEKARPATAGNADLTPGSVEEKDPLAAPRTDDSVVKAQATGDPAGSAEAPLPTADRLPLGKQAVAVTVDVQAPASMNLGKFATLKLIVRNTGMADAFNVRVDDELPEGLMFDSSVPDLTVSGKGQHLSLLIPTLPAGQDKVVSIKVKPTKTGPFDHAATIRFETGCKTRTRVLEPKLKVDIVANPSVGKVLKGQQVVFNVSVQNTGDGPARNVAIQARLSPGLMHESGPRGDEQMLYELSLAELGPGATEKLDPLVADAIVGGEQYCAVTAHSDDVLPNKEGAENVSKIEVVEPKLKLAIEGPDQRFTDTTADYKITLENPGTAPARKIRVLATLPINGRLVKVPPDAHYDKATSKLSWTVDQLDQGAKPLSFEFQVRMGGIATYEVIADAIAEGGLKPHERKMTDVIGMPDVDLVVSEPKRVLDIGGTTTFQIRLKNYGTKEATNLVVAAELSKNLQFEKAGGGAQTVEVKYNKEKNAVSFVRIDKLGPNKEMILGIKVMVTGAEPKQATCRVFVKHDDLPDGNRFEDMAAIRVTTARRAPVIDAGGR
jgi:uncharacterized repeat protein (TIGR01451 family)